MKYNFEELKARVEHSRRYENNARVLPADVNETVREWLRSVDPELVPEFDLIEGKQWHHTWILVDKQNPEKSICIKFNYGIVENYEIIKKNDSVKWYKQLSTKIKNEKVFFGKRNNNKPYQGENK